MDIASLLGIVLAAVLLAVSVITAKGAAPAAFFDLSALLLVGGGALAAMLIAMPLRNGWNSLRVCRRVFFNRRPNLTAVISEIVGLAHTARRDGILALEARLLEVSDPFLALGLQMAVDGNRPEVIEETLRIKMDAIALRHKQGRLGLEQMGRYAPAFGMIGTLLGLIVMLGNMHNPEAVGPGMAVAMLTTLYGLLLANLICLPFAEKLQLLSKQEMLAMEVMLRGIVGIQSGENPRVLEQKLTTFLPASRSAIGVPTREAAQAVEARLDKLLPKPPAQQTSKKAA
jgi:chemotaxis protein MotA